MNNRSDDSVDLLDDLITETGAGNLFTIVYLQSLTLFTIIDFALHLKIEPVYTIVDRIIPVIF